MPDPTALKPSLELLSQLSRFTELPIHALDYTIQSGQIQGQFQVIASQARRDRRYGFTWKGNTLEIQPAPTPALFSYRLALPTAAVVTQRRQLTQKTSQDVLGGEGHRDRRRQFFRGVLISKAFDQLIAHHRLMPQGVTHG